MRDKSIFPTYVYVDKVYDFITNDLSSKSKSDLSSKSKNDLSSKSKNDFSSKIKNDLSSKSEIDEIQRITFTNKSTRLGEEVSFIILFKHERKLCILYKSPYISIKVFNKFEYA